MDRVYQNSWVSSTHFPIFSFLNLVWVIPRPITSGLSGGEAKEKGRLFFFSLSKATMMLPSQVLPVEFKRPSLWPPATSLSTHAIPFPYPCANHLRLMVTLSERFSTVSFLHSVFWGRISISKNMLSGDGDSVQGCVFCLIRTLKETGWGPGQA